jgi:MFS family permease
MGMRRRSGLSVGPPIGGLLLSTLHWRWIFWVTGPIGGAVTAIGRQQKTP